jgi:hypothetical protein
MDNQRADEATQGKEKKQRSAKHFHNQSLLWILLAFLSRETYKSTLLMYLHLSSFHSPFLFQTFEPS